MATVFWKWGGGDGLVIFIDLDDASESRFGDHGLAIGGSLEGVNVGFF